MKSLVNKIVICSLGAIVFLFVFCDVTAQQRRVIKLYKSSGIVESMPVSFLDSVMFEWEDIPVINNNTILPEDVEAYNQRMQWWNDARYGMFIHYGLYSVLGGKYYGVNLRGEEVKFQSYGNLNTKGDGVTRGDGSGAEWIFSEAKIPRKEYKKFLPQFTGANWNPEQIIDKAVKCGFKYIIITAKHHEGFCLWDSEVTDFDIGSTPAGELWNGDMILPLADKARAAGLKFGIYISHALDWMHEGALGNIPEIGGEYTYEEKCNYMQKYTYPMLKDIFIRYNPDVIWWDAPYTNPYEEFAEGCLDILKEYASSDIIQDDRLSILDGYKGDYKTLEQSMNENTATPNAEWCMSLNYTWGYNQYDTSYKESGYILYSLLRCAKVGVNMLINIGPMGDGLVLDNHYGLIEPVGDFLEKCGEGVYGTTRSPLQYNFPYGPVTYKDIDGQKNLYYNIFYWDASGKLYLPGIMNDVEDVDITFVDKPELEFEVEKIPGIGLCLKGLPKTKFFDIATQVKISFTSQPELREGLPEIENKINLTSMALKYQGGEITMFSSHPALNWYSGKEIRYKIIVPQDATYKVEGHLSAEASGTITFNFQNGQTLVGNNVPTGGGVGRNFNWQDLGTITLKAGEYEVLVTGQQSASWIKLREFRFTRVE